MKKQRGEVLIATVVVMLVAGFLVIVTNGGQRSLSQKAAEAPAPAVVQVAEAQKYRPVDEANAACIWEAMPGLGHEAYPDDKRDLLGELPNDGL